MICHQPASSPIIISLFSPACCRGTQARNLPPAQSSLVCVCVCAVQPMYTPSPYISNLVNLPSRTTVSSMFTSMPVRPAARLRSMSCLSPCREVRSRSVVVSAPAPPPPVLVLVTLLPTCAHCPSPCPVPVPSHQLLHVHTHTYIVDSHPAAATATEHPLRGRVEARRPRGEAV